MTNDLQPFWVIVDENGVAASVGTYEQCNKYINDAVEEDVENAGSWRLLRGLPASSNKAAPVKPSGLLPHEDRVVAEAKELFDKLGQLMNFVNSDKFAEVDAVARSLLSRQASAMMTYGAVLRERIVQFRTRF